MGIQQDPSSRDLPLAGAFPARLCGDVRNVSEGIPGPYPGLSDCFGVVVRGEEVSIPTRVYPAGRAVSAPVHHPVIPPLFGQATRRAG